MHTDIVDHFNDRAGTFDKAEWVRDPRVMAELLEFMSLSPGKRVLDIGAGTGAVLSAALEACPKLGECVALDLSTSMLAHIADPRIRKCCDDAERLPFADGSFDVAVCRQALHYINDLDCSLGEIRRALSPDGIFVVGQTTPFGHADEQWWKLIVKARQPLRRHLLTLHDLLELLMRNAFVVARISQIRTTESLNGWLARYEWSAKQVAEVRRLHQDAPRAYRELHHFREEDGDTLVDNCWTFIQARKP